jgi:hypothetical protein
MSNAAFNKRVRRQLCNLFQEASVNSAPCDTDSSDVSYNYRLDDNQNSPPSLETPVFDVPFSEDDTGLGIFDNSKSFDSIIQSIFENKVPEAEYVETSNVDENGLTLAEELLFFFIAFNIPRKAMEQLLFLLRKHNVLGVPTSVYMLRKGLQTVPIDIISVENMNYAYLGIQENLEFLLNRNILSIQSGKDPVLIDLSMNIDGLPLFKSSRINIWPILMSVNKALQPLPVAVFCGIGKPNLLVFLSQFCAELTNLTDNGFSFQEMLIKIRKVIFICDSPARSFLLNTKGHASFNGCHWCRQVGYFSHDRVAYQTTLGSLRTDNDYKNFKESNQIRDTPLRKVVPLYSAFPPDFMHVVCLGVVKKLFKFYCTSIKGIRLSCKLTSSQLDRLNDRISVFKMHTPSEFQRKPRPVSELAYFKASEFRNFLMYVGPFVLKSVLPPLFYDHFLLLHYAIYIYSSTKHSNLYVNAQACIELFVNDFSENFHPALVSFNIHALLHIPQFVDLCGPVSNFSAFPYENFLSFVKRRIRANNGIFKQSLNQLLNIRNLYTHATSNAFRFSSSSPNNCAILSNGTYILVQSVFNGCVTGTVLRFSRDLYCKPFPSSSLGIGFYRVSEKRVDNAIAVNKAIMIPIESELLVFPLV